MDLTIHVKVELIETPALINCFAAFCSTTENYTKIVNGLQATCEPETVQPVAVQEEQKPEPKAPSCQPEPPKAPAPKKYTLDDFRSACVPLMDADPANTQKLQGIIKGFGVESLAQLPEDKYEELAEKLRALGGKL